MFTRCAIVVHTGRERFEVVSVGKILLDPCRNAWSKNCYAFVHGPKNIRFRNSLPPLNTYIRRYEIVKDFGRERL